MRNKKIKQRRYPDFNLIETSHLLDSVWVKKDRTELKIVFATGQILEFRPVYKEEKSL
jgi:hypothetical protein